MKLDERQPLTEAFLHKELLILFRNMRFYFIPAAAVILLICPPMLWGCVRSVSDPAGGIPQKCAAAVIAVCLLAMFVYLIGAACELVRFYLSVQKGKFRVVEDTLKRIPEPGDPGERPRFVILRRMPPHSCIRFCFEKHGTVYVPADWKGAHSPGDVFYLVLVGDGIEKVYSVRGYKKS